eukprot:6482559-Amphidinium_carterae.1
MMYPYPYQIQKAPQNYQKRCQTCCKTSASWGALALGWGVDGSSVSEFRDREQIWSKSLEVPKALAILEPKYFSIA